VIATSSCRQARITFDHLVGFLADKLDDRKE